LGNYNEKIVFIVLHFSLPYAVDQSIIVLVGKLENKEARARLLKMKKLGLMNETLSWILITGGVTLCQPLGKGNASSPWY
jgi:hypothetical protein